MPNKEQIDKGKKKSPDPKELVAKLAGCLGQEAASEYDWELEIEGLYQYFRHFRR